MGTLFKLSVLFGALLPVGLQTLGYNSILGCRWTYIKHECTLDNHNFSWFDNPSGRLCGYFEIILRHTTVGRTPLDEG
jgi:hypothetical protein